MGKQERGFGAGKIDYDGLAREVRGETLAFVLEALVVGLQQHFEVSQDEIAGLGAPGVIEGLLGVQFVMEERDNQEVKPEWYDEHFREGMRHFGEKVLRGHGVENKDDLQELCDELREKPVDRTEHFSHMAEGCQAAGEIFLILQNEFRAM